MRHRLNLALLVLALLLITTTVFAQTGSGYDLTWSTIDGGGGTSSGGTYLLDGTIGQFDAGVMSGGAYTLSGGFWGSLNVTAQIEVFLPLILR